MSSLEPSRSNMHRKPRPQTWKYSDTFDKARHIPFLRSRCQAKFRNEEWTLTFEEFCEFWDTPEKWAQRGRQADELTLTRKDITGPWSKDNCEVVTRYEQLTRSSFLRRGAIYNIPNRKGTPKNAR